MYAPGCTYAQPCVHSIKCVLLMVRLTQYMGIVHLGGAFEVSTTRIQVYVHVVTLYIVHQQHQRTVTVLRNVK